jgi:hypothetical protein
VDNTKWRPVDKFLPGDRVVHLSVPFVPSAARRGTVVAPPVRSGLAPGAQKGRIYVHWDGADTDPQRGVFFDYYWLGYQLRKLSAVEVLAEIDQ